MEPKSTRRPPARNGFERGPFRASSSAHRYVDEASGPFHSSRNGWLKPLRRGCIQNDSLILQSQRLKSALGVDTSGPAKPSAASLLSIDVWEE